MSYILPDPAPNRTLRQPQVRRRWVEERQGGKHWYHQMDDGSIRRLEHGRHVRRALGLSPRQYRKARRAERREAPHG